MAQSLIPCIIYLFIYLSNTIFIKYTSFKTIIWIQY